MIIPCGTDAPIYHLPITTCGLIAANVAIFGWESLSGANLDPYCLALGAGLHPVQWVTHVFLHANLAHLIGNMLFLGCFGLVVEGKVGWWRFLLLYLGIGASVGMIIQLAMLGAAGGSALGASAAIFGVLAIACVWAPLNEVDLVWIVYYRVYHFKATLAMVAAWYVGWDILVLALTEFAFSGAAAHVLGALLGIVAGFGMLLRNAVDCDGYDLLSLNRARGAHVPDASRIETTPSSSRRERLIAERIRDARPQVAVFLAQGNVDAAMRLMDKLKGIDERVDWQRDELQTLIAELLRGGRWEEAIPQMEAYCDRFSDRANAVRLQLARVLVVRQHRPAKALRVLAAIPRDRLPKRQQALFDRIARRAKRMQDQGFVEVSLD